MAALTLHNILPIGYLLTIISILILNDVNCASYIQTLSMPGTTLATGIFYRIDLKSTGLLSWSFQKTKDGNYLQVVYGEAAKEFEPGGRYWIDSQWMFERSEKPGYYTMLNKNETHAVIAALPNSPSTSGLWVGLIMNKDKDPDYLEGGKYRSHALWKIVPEHGKTDEDPASTNQYYNIYNAFYEEGGKKGGLLTWATRDVYPGKKFVQVYDDEDSSKYWNNADYLYKITPSSEWTFSAEVTDFSTNRISRQSVSADSSLKYLVKNVPYKNPNEDKPYTYTFQKTYIRKNSYKFTFDDDVKFFAFIRIQGRALSIDCNELNFFAKFDEYKEGKPITSNELAIFNYDLTLNLFNGKCEKVHATYFNFNRPNVKFSAEFGIKGITDVMTRDTRVVERSSVYGNAVKAALQRVTGFKKAKWTKNNLSFAMYNATGVLDADIAFEKGWEKYRFNCKKFDETKPIGGEGELDTTKTTYPDAHEGA